MFVHRVNREEGIAAKHKCLRDGEIHTEKFPLSSDNIENGEGGIRTRGRGVNPYDGLANRCTKNINTEKTKTCKTAKTQLTPQLTPKSQKQGEIDTKKLPPDLAEIVAVWPQLPPAIRSAIVAIVRTSKGQ